MKMNYVHKISMADSGYWRIWICELSGFLTDFFLLFSPQFTEYSLKLPKTRDRQHWVSIILGWIFLSDHFYCWLSVNVDNGDHQHHCHTDYLHDVIPGELSSSS